MTDYSKWLFKHERKLLKRKEVKMNIFTKGFGPFGPNDLNKILKGLLIAIGGAALTFLLGVVNHYGGVNPSVYYVVFSLLINAALKALDGQKS